MKWKEFYAIVVTEEIQQRESQKNVIVRFSTWVARRIAYILHFTPITGNMVSFFRILMVFVAVYLFSLIEEGAYGSALIGIAIMALQMNADGVDGALARSQKKSSFFGDRIDNFGIDYAVLATLIVISNITGEKSLVLLSCLSVYIIVTFRQHVGLKIPKRVFMFFRNFFYTPIILIAVPLLMVLLSYFEVPIILLSWVVTITYIVLAIVWLIVCSWLHLLGKNKDVLNSLYKDDQSSPWID